MAQWRLAHPSGSVVLPVCAVAFIELKGTITIIMHTIEPDYDRRSFPCFYADVYRTKDAHRVKGITPIGQYSF